MYVCLYVCMYACMYVCMYGCETSCCHSAGPAVDLSFDVSCDQRELLAEAPYYMLAAQISFDTKKYGQNPCEPQQLW